MSEVTTGVCPRDFPWPELGRRLDALARGACVGTLLTLVEPWPRAADACRGCFPADRAFDAWVRPDEDDWRLGLGHAAVVESAGRGRYSALAAAQRAWAAAWRCDDPYDSGYAPLAWAGFAFAASAGAGAPLPNARLAVPAVLLRRRAGRVFALFTCVAERAGDAIDHWRGLLAALENAPPQPAALPAVLAGAADARAWGLRTEAALASIAAGELDKVVLARRLRLKAATPFHAGGAFAALAADNPRCAVFAAGVGAAVFLGATPERLVRLTRGTVVADALAGTAWAGAEPLSCDKNRREHEFVTRAVAAALAPLCASLVPPAVPESYAVGEIEHLRVALRGRVRENVGLFDLAACLHPTPAVGGTPTAAALDWLDRHDEVRGAWYSGAVGWVDRDGDGELAVALRCGLIQGRDAELYAGAGIVAGSQPEQEYRETAMKLNPMLRALGAAESLAAGSGHDGIQARSA